MKKEVKNIDVKESAKQMKDKGFKFINEFKAFVLKGNVMDMAIGVIIGGAFTSIVSALTADFINPLINCFGGAEVKGQLEIFNTGQYINWGHFLTAVINFLIMAAVLFVLLKVVHRITDIGHKKEVVEEKVEAPKSDEALLLEEIRDLLKKNK